MLRRENQIDVLTETIFNKRHVLVEFPIPNWKEFKSYSIFSTKKLKRKTKYTRLSFLNKKWF